MAWTPPEDHTESQTLYNIDQVSPYIEEIGCNDARVDARAGNRERYTTYLAFFNEALLSTPNWHAYREAYEAERARIGA